MIKDACVCTPEISYFKKNGALVSQRVGYSHCSLPVSGIYMYSSAEYRYVYVIKNKQWKSNKKISVLVNRVSPSFVRF